MRQLRLLIIAIATICVLALGAFALVNRTTAPPNPGDDIIIKGGSLTIECTNAANKNCIAPFDNTNKNYKHKNGGGKIEKIVIMDSAGNALPNGTFTRSPNFPDGKPQVFITYQ